MTGPRHRLASPGTVTGVLVAAAGALLAGCGGGSSHAVQSTSAPAPSPVTHADPVTLLPTSAEVARLIKPMAPPTRYDHRLNSSTLSSAFATAVPRSQRLASGAAELDVVGRKGAFLYVHVFEFRTLAGAQSLTSTFLSSTRLRNRRDRPSGAPGQQGQASSRPYGTGQVSYRYAFRAGNVLAYVELDGAHGRFSLADLTRLATLTARRVKVSSA